MSNPKKLTQELIEAIYAEPKSLTVKAIAEKYGVSCATVTRARSGLPQGEAQERANSTKKMIQSLLSDGKPRTAKQIGEEIDVRTSTVSSTICSMERDNPPQVERCGVVKGEYSTYPLWRLVAAKEADVEDESATAPKRTLPAPHEYAPAPDWRTGTAPPGRSAYFQRYGVDLT